MAQTERGLWQKRPMDDDDDEYKNLIIALEQELKIFTVGQVIQCE